MPPTKKVVKNSKFSEFMKRKNNVSSDDNDDLLYESELVVPQKKEEPVEKKDDVVKEAAASEKKDEKLYESDNSKLIHEIHSMMKQLQDERRANLKLREDIKKLKDVERENRKKEREKTKELEREYFTSLILAGKKQEENRIAKIAQAAKVDLQTKRSMLFTPAR